MPKQTPTRKLTPLRWGSPYCELCRSRIRLGELVNWQQATDRHARPRWTAYCGTCAGQPLTTRRRTP
jgi:hypothetical protein